MQRLFEGCGEGLEDASPESGMLRWRSSMDSLLEVRSRQPRCDSETEEAIVIIQLRSSIPQRIRACGQVAQLVERSPEKAGVGGSIPSLATTFQRL